jgi:acetoin utilization deacetylase AcuC-like enzyme
LPQKRVQLLYNPQVLGHQTGTHPENRQRIAAFGDLTPEPQPLDGEPFLSLVHSPAYIDLVRQHCAQSLPLDGDTLTTPTSFTAATAAVGATIQAMERGDFALVRPPGHHAYREQARGFCLFNNIAIAAQKAVNEGKRVLILDFDGHLGDGTMDIFYHSDQVLFWSLHQWPAYPGNGAAVEIGAGPGKGYTINVPLPAGSGDDIFLHAVAYFWSAALQFNPDVVAISAGFDAHQFDPLLQLRATGNFYYKIGAMLRETFPGKVFASLEGGYNTEELVHGVRNFLAGFNAQPMPYPETGTTSGLRLWETYELHLNLAAGLLSAHWKL